MCKCKCVCACVRASMKRVQFNLLLLAVSSHCHTMLTVLSVSQQGRKERKKERKKERESRRKINRESQRGKWRVKLRAVSAITVKQHSPKKTKLVFKHAEKANASLYRTFIYHFHGYSQIMHIYIYVHNFRWQVKSRHWTQSNLNS